MRNLFFVLLSLFLLSACVTPSPYESRPGGQTPTLPPSPEPNVKTQPAPAPERPGAPQPLPSSPTTPQPKPRSLGPAARALLGQAQTQMNAGNPALAAATIERALRIEPDNPLLWIELAKVRQDEGNAAQAENLARKALAMSTGDGKAQAAAWRVIADSLRARGRNPEARDADAKALSAGG